ncbi:zinc-ribbon domain-containing protein [uncultured Tateyamaria sp.]|uniref:zinc-ribbon domain-containing protein n=1 Tax=uncultured Tateyamaria sp. TaxID=455651 RepID=UPI00261072DF|nr:zinc-ribbon domain-containing protein [uncultured Tateyamaria sp.]
MRLICPNCDAQYEVVDDVIPSEGRDVQCSNCGQTWFQHHPDYAPDEPEEADAPADLAPPDDTPVEDEERVDAPDHQRRELDPSIADILRQEAEIEAQARATEAESLESQPDLGLDSAETDSDRRAREARERMARMRGEDSGPEHVSEAAATAAAIGSRRDLLPDIEEINSTLRSTGDRQTAPAADVATDPAEAAPRKSGFRRGFMLMILLAVILGAIYVFAPDIARAVPQVDPFLSAYVAQVDSARVWLDGRVATGLTWLENLSAPVDEG